MNAKHMNHLMILGLGGIGSMPVSLAAPPVVSNVRAAQIAQTKTIEILYDVADADGDPLAIGMQVSGDAGLSYTIPVTALSGHIGAGVTPGTNRRIVWDAGADWNGQLVTKGKVRITANDGSAPPPPPGMVYIPAGPFQMGDSYGELNSNTLPLHNVQVDAIFMDRLEVSKELWIAVQAWGEGRGYSIAIGSWKAAGHPVAYVSWYDCVKWCNARSEMEGLVPCYYTDDSQLSIYKIGNSDLTNAKVKWTANGYRLPTEAEWEKAARGGVLGLRYPWGDNLANHQANYNGSGDPFDSLNGSFETTPVGYYNGGQTPAGINMANGYGLYDMAGNLSEWCWDIYSSGYYSDAAAGANPRGPETLVTINRAVRGGSWADTNTSGALKCAGRSQNAPGAGSQGPTYGLRCVKGL